tara:strand:- start:613 stop:1629 length:1017 start_codon:yes stop_codon:yes gene_type:complete
MSTQAQHEVQEVQTRESQESTIRAIMSEYKGTREEYEKLVSSCRRIIPQAGRTRREATMGRISGKGKKKAESFDAQMGQYKNTVSGLLEDSAPEEYRKKFQMWERYMYVTIERGGKQVAPFYETDKGCYDGLIELGYFKSLDTVEKCKLRATEESKKPKKARKGGRKKLTEEEKALRAAKKEEEKKAKLEKRAAEKAAKAAAKEEEKKQKAEKRILEKEAKAKKKAAEKAAEKAAKAAAKEDSKKKKATKKKQKKKALETEAEKELKGTLTEDSYVEDEEQKKKDKEFQEKANACQYESDDDSSDGEEQEVFDSDDEDFQAAQANLQKLKSTASSDEE